VISTGVLGSAYRSLRAAPAVLQCYVWTAHVDPPVWVSHSVREGVLRHYTLRSNTDKPGTIPATTRSRSVRTPAFEILPCARRRFLPVLTGTARFVESCYRRTASMRVPHHLPIRETAERRLVEFGTAGKIPIAGRFTWKRPTRSHRALWWFPGIAEISLKLEKTLFNVQHCREGTRLRRQHQARKDTQLLLRDFPVQIEGSGRDLASSEPSGSSQTCFPKTRRKGMAATPRPSSRSQKKQAPRRHLATRTSRNAPRARAITR